MDESGSGLCINAAAFVKDTRVVGPGVRDALWVQGCSIRCPGCGNPDFLVHAPRRLLPVPVLVQHFKSRRGQIDGISVLGGEPTEQAEPMAALLEAVQGLGLSTVVFTGRLYEDLIADPDPFLARLVAATDLLIDGPFIAAQHDRGLAWRGSHNQRLLYLTPRLAPQLPAGPNDVEVVINDGSLLVTGTAAALIQARP